MHKAAVTARKDRYMEAFNSGTEPEVELLGPEIEVQACCTAAKEAVRLAKACSLQVPELWGFEPENQKAEGEESTSPGQGPENAELKQQLEEAKTMAHALSKKYTELQREQKKQSEIIRSLRQENGDLQQEATHYKQSEGWRTQQNKSVARTAATNAYPHENTKITGISPQPGPNEKIRHPRFRWQNQTDDGSRM